MHPPVSGDSLRLLISSSQGSTRSAACAAMRAVASKCAANPNTPAYSTNSPLAPDRVRHSEARRLWSDSSFRLGHGRTCVDAVEVCVSRRFRQDEVENLDAIVAGHLDIRGLQVAMDDALFMRVFERSAIWRAMRRASSIGIAPCAMRSASVVPSANCITSARDTPHPSRPRQAERGSRSRPAANPSIASYCGQDSTSEAIRAGPRISGRRG